MIVSNICTLEELETVYSLDDVLRANAVLDVKAEIESVMFQNIKTKTGK